MFTLTTDEVHYSDKQFGAWRIAFGAYLSFFYLRTFPYARELLSREGAFPDVSLSGVATFFPTFLLRMDSVVQAQAVLALCVGLSLLIMLGWRRRTAALFLWLLVTWLYNRNPYSNSPEYEFVNWLILACVFIPAGESYSLSDKKPDWFMPRSFYWGAWIVLAAGYFYAGSSKFRGHDAQWMNGSALYYILAGDNSRFPWYGNFFDHIPRLLFLPLTWGALCCQTLAPLFVCWRRARPWWWLVSTAVHVSLLCFVDLGQLTLGMIFFHLFLFDARWLASAREALRSRASESIRLNPSPDIAPVQHVPRGMPTELMRR